MIRNLSTELVRSLLAKADISVVQDKDGRFLTVLKSNEQFNHDVVIRLDSCQGNRLTLWTARGR